MYSQLLIFKYSTLLCINKTLTTNQMSTKCRHTNEMLN